MGGSGLDGGSGDQIISNINVTPLVDVVLVLLIIFMVTASYIAKSQFQVDLPRAASGESEVKSTLTFEVNEEGDYRMNGEPTTLESIGRRAGEAIRQNPQTRAIIAADRDVRYARVIDLIDTIKQNGLSKFALNLETEGSGS
jgi:biopolymer transport protein ExbD